MAEKPLLIIHIFDEIGNSFLNICQCLVFPTTHYLRSQGFDKYFSISIIEGVINRRDCLCGLYQSENRII